MGNNITQNPWVLDSAGVVTTKHTPVKRMVWHEPTTASHVLLLVNQKGIEIWSKTAIAGGAGMDYELADVGFIDGLTITTLQSGTLKVYIGR